jgi:hypothetical protein
MANLEKGQVITPDKKNVIIDALNSEIKNLNEKLRNKEVDDFMRGGLSSSRQTLQNILNSVLDKKGVFTPDETTEIVNKIDEAKRQRLRQNYVVGMKKSAFYILGFVVIGATIYWYSRKKI